MRKKELKIFLGFMKSQWAAWVILCLSAVIFFLLDMLGLTSSPYTVYGIFLLTFLTFVIMFINYVKYRARALTLLKAFEHMSLDVSDLPNPGDFEGECYTAIIDALHRKMAEAVHRLDENYIDQIDYYSMWVHQIKTVGYARADIITIYGVWHFFIDISDICYYVYKLCKVQGESTNAFEGFRTHEP